MKQRRLLGIVGGLVVAAFLVAACAAPAAPPTPAAPKKAEEKPTPAPPPAKKPAEAEKKYEWKLSTYVGTTHTVAVLLREFAKNVETKTNGRLKITVYPAGELPFKPTEFVSTVGKRNLELADGYVGFVSGELPIGGIGALPFLIADHEELQKAYPLIEPFLKKALEKFNTDILFWYTWPVQNFYLKKKVTTLDDFKGTKIRVTGPEQGEMLKRLGAVSVTLTTAEVPTAFERGVVDGVTTAAFNLVASKWDDFTKYAYMIDIHIGGPAYILVNKDALKELPDDLRKALQEAGAEAHAKMLAEIPVKGENEARELIKKKGIELIVATKEDKEKARKLMETYWEEWAKQVGPDGEAALKAVRQALGK